MLLLWAESAAHGRAAVEVPPAEAAWEWLTLRALAGWLTQLMREAGHDEGRCAWDELFVVLEGAIELPVAAAWIGLWPS